VLAGQDHRAVLEQVAGVARIALAEEDLAALPGPGNGRLGDLLQLPLGQVAEDLGAGE
jgi:hypothetical protein